MCCPARDMVLVMGLSDNYPALEPDARGYLPCPCCGYWTLEVFAAFDICPVCFWEDDPIQFDDPSYRGGANAESLNEARAVASNHINAKVLAHDMLRPPLPEEGPPFEWLAPKHKIIRAPRAPILL